MMYWHELLKIFNKQQKLLKEEQKKRTKKTPKASDWKDAMTSSSR